MSLIEFPCGVGVPHAQPDCPFATCACAGTAITAATTRPANADFTALESTRTFSSLDGLLTQPQRGIAHPNGTADTMLRVLSSHLVDGALARDLDVSLKAPLGLRSGPLGVELVGEVRDHQAARAG